MAKEGDTLDGKYLLRRMLGDGGMGRVFLAENIRLGNKAFALKTLKPEYLSNKDVVERFLAEALAASKVEHDNIVEVFHADIDAATGIPFIVQRYLRGINLREYLNACPDRRLPPGEALEYLVPIMGALVATHKQQIIHRDIKPENIFLVKTSSGNTVPKLIDFGIAKHLEPEVRTRRSDTRSGSIWGTFDYMSPEQARGERSIDVRADIWSMGAVLFEALTGRLPYQVDGHATLLQCIAEGAPPRIDAVRPALPRDLADAVERALQVDRDKRWPTMASFISALINCGEYQSTVTWRHIPLSTPDLGVVPDLTALARPATEEHPRRNATRSAITVDDSRVTSSYMLERIVPHRMTARGALPYAIGVAAVLVGIALGMQLRSAAARQATPTTLRSVTAPPSVAPPRAPVVPVVPAAPPEVTSTIVPPAPLPSLPRPVARAAPAPPRTPVRARVSHARRASTAVRTQSPSGAPLIQTEF